MKSFDKDLERNGAIILFPDLVNIYDCTIGDSTTIGPFVEIQRGVIIGKRCKIKSHTFICGGVTIENDVFVGHGVTFTNDRYPDLKNACNIIEKTIVREGAIIGSGAVILPGIEIGEGAIVGAGAVVTKDVNANRTVVGNPARELQKASRGL
jgi:acetyltransferase-like isoleucine patch superfamily enzyme